LTKQKYYGMSFGSSFESAISEHFKQINLYLITLA